MSLVVRSTPAPPDGWDAFVRAHGTFYHEAAWVGALRDAFEFAAHFVVALRGHAIVGVLPLLEVPALSGSRRLVSLPFSYATGAAVVDDEAREALARHAIAFARERGIRRVELKSRDADAPTPTGFARVTRYSTYVLSTEGGVDAAWKRLHPSHVQRGIRKARKSELLAERGTSEAAWRELAELQARTSHRQGIPSPPESFFVEHCRALQEQGLADLLLARLPDGRAAAGVVLWKGPREWIYAFGPSVPAELERRPVHLLLWTAIEQAAAAGVPFDLGRAAPEQTGLVEFKRRWGGEPVPLAYDYWPAPSGLNVAARDEGPLAIVNRVWSRLPFGVARRGSFLYRYMG